MGTKEQVLKILKAVDFVYVRDTEECYSLYGKTIKEDLFHIDLSTTVYSDAGWRTYRPYFNILSLRLL